MAAIIRAIPNKIFHTLGLKKVTGLANIRIPANNRRMNAPTNTNLSIAFGKQATKTIYMIPRQSPKINDSHITSSEFKIEFFIEI